MTVGKLFKTMVFIPLLIATFVYPIYLAVIENVSIYEGYSVLHMLTVIAGHILLLVSFIIVLCYTICNWEEDLKSWWSYKNLRYYLKEGRPNKHNRKNW